MPPELADGSRGRRITVVKKEKKEAKSFVFHEVFGEDTTQESLYDQVAKPLLARAALKGVSATILAYGQTGSGKTHTIMGENSDSGVVPRLVDDLHERYGASNISACFVQLYNNEFRDLFGRVGRTVSAREVAGGGLELADAAEIRGDKMDSAAMKAKILEGNEYRATGETNMNDASSRSHAILTFKVN